MIRPLDNAFVTKLKSEILERCSTFVKRLIAVVNNITDKTNFDEKKLHEYVLEVIGGNHRREAYSQLEQEKKLDEAQLYNCQSSAIYWYVYPIHKLPQRLR